MNRKLHLNTHENFPTLKCKRIDGFEVVFLFFCDNFSTYIFITFRSLPQYQYPLILVINFFKFEMLLHIYVLRQEKDKSMNCLRKLFSSLLIYLLSVYYSEEQLFAVLGSNCFGKPPQRVIVSN